MGGRSFLKVKSNDFMEMNTTPASGVLVHCRTVVEKKDFVSSGVLTIVDGDVVEVEIGDYKVFELGDPVKLTVYTPVGIFMFHSTVIAKDKGFLIFINPPANRKKFSEKRGHSRIEVKIHGFLKLLLGEDEVVFPTEQEDDNETREEKKENSRLVPLNINNISVSGIGFTLADPLYLLEGEIVDIELDLGFKLSCTVEVMRISPAEKGKYYGTTITEISPIGKNALRAYIIKVQIDILAQRKQEVETKRTFK